MAIVRKKTNLILVLILFLFALSGVSSFGWAETITKWKESPGSGEYPEAKALVLRDHITYTIMHNGDTELKEHEVIKPLNKKGLKKYRHAYRSYINGRQEFHVDVARIIKPDGAVINLDRKKQVVTEAKFASQLPHYKDLMVVTLDFSQAEADDIIEYKVRLVTKKPFIPRYNWSVSFVNDEVPLLFTKFTVKMHRNADRMNWYCAGFKTGQLKPKVTKISGGKEFDWELKNRKATIEEPHDPGFREKVAYIMVSSCPSWKDMSRAYYNLFRPYVTPDKKTRDAVNKMMKKDDDQMDKLVKLTRFFKGKKIIGWDFDTDHLILNRPSDILDKKRITKMDANLLYVAMVRAAGFEAYPALLADRKSGMVEEKMPSPYQFNRVLALVKIEGNWRYIDAAYTYDGIPKIGSGNEGRSVLELTPRGEALAVTPVSPATANREKVISQAKLLPDGSVGVRMKLRESGNKKTFWKAYMQILKITKRQTAVYQKLVQVVAPNAKLMGFNVDEWPRKDLLELELTFMVNDFISKSGSLWVVPLPINSAKKPDFLEMNVRKRVYPLVMGSTSQDVKEMSMEIPEGFSIVSLPRSLFMKNSVGSLDIKSTYEGNTIRYNYDLKIKKDRLPISEIPKLIELYDTAVEASNEVIILRKQQ